METMQRAKRLAGDGTVVLTLTLAEANVAQCILRSAPCPTKDLAAFDAVDAKLDAAIDQAKLVYGK